MASRIPEDFIDQLLERVDIVDLIQRYVPLKRSGSEFSACCPFHTEKTPSFYVSPQKQFFHCFGCGAHGTALGFLMQHQNLGFVEAVTYLAEQTGMTIPAQTQADQAPDQHEPLWQALAAAAHYYQEQLAQNPKAQAYLQQRGIGRKTAEAYGLGWAPWGETQGLTRHLGERFSSDILLKAGLQNQREAEPPYDRFRKRLMFPIRDRRGRIVGFGGRLIEAGEPKYLNSPETPLFHKSELIYGLYEARMATTRLEELVVTEGYMDVVGLAEAGFRQAVACMGTALNRSHFEQLFRQVRRLVLCLDGDAAGRRAAERALEQLLPLLHDEREVRFLFLPDGDDPDSLVRREGLQGWEQRLTQTLPLSAALMHVLATHHSLEHPEGRSRFAHAAVHHIRHIPDPLFREQLLQLTAKQTHSAVATLQQLMQQIAAREPARTRESASPPATPAGTLSSPAAGQVSPPLTDQPAAARRGAGHSAHHPLWSALMARVLQKNHLNWSVPEIETLLDTQSPAARILADVLLQIRQNAPDTPAGVLHAFRSQTFYHRLEELAHLVLDEEDDEVSWRIALDSARSLAREHYRMAIRQLTENANCRSREEMQELQRLYGTLRSIDQTQPSYEQR